MTPSQEVAHQLYLALKIAPCRCQMKGAEKWHLQAQREVATKCSRCVALDAYEALPGYSRGQT
jgi:hypothetical protein